MVWQLTHAEVLGADEFRNHIANEAKWIRSFEQMEREYLKDIESGEIIRLNAQEAQIADAAMQ